VEVENAFIQLFPNRELTKSQLTQLKIVRHAIDCIASQGIHQVNFTHFADSAKVTRPLVKHYFKDIQELHLLAARFVRLRFQEWVVEQVKKAPDPGKALKVYVEACLQWPTKFTSDANFWGQFQSLCLIHPLYRKLHEEVAEIGRKRIGELLAHSGVSKDRIEGLSLGVQSMIMGAIWTIGLETKANPSVLRDQILQTIHKK
jgi:AcrR family transcriptional regulator